MSIRKPLLLLFAGVLLASTANVRSQRVVAHRGATIHHTENSLEALLEAVKLKVDAVECDIWRTANDTLVLMHDRKTGRTANADLAVPESTAAQIRRLRLKNGEKIPTLEDVLKKIPKGKKIIVEIKHYKEKGDTGKSFPLLSDLLLKTGRVNDVTLISFNAETLAEAKKHLPEIKCYFLSAKENIEDELIEICLKYQLDGLNVGYKILTDSLVEKSRKNKLDLWVWTVNTPEQVQNCLGKVTTITTDQPVLVKKMVKKYNKNIRRRQRKDLVVS